MQRYPAAGQVLSAFDYLMDASHEPCVDSIPLPGKKAAVLAWAIISARLPCPGPPVFLCALVHLRFLLLERE